jgi:predicted phage terminase large subunit-like protein
VGELFAHVEGGEIFGACDPSMGIAGRNRDDAAIVTVMKDRRSGMMYVLDADIARRKPEDIINVIIQYHRMRRFERFGTEAVQFQAFLAKELGRIAAKAGERLSVEAIRHGRDKMGRIQSLEPLVTTGMLQFSRRHATLIEQLRQFPRASHDDGPDALEMAVGVAQRGNYRTVSRAY